MLSTDYSGSGFDRGHHTPSADRTSSIPDNSATFFMTNMMPQAPNNNQGPWEELETYCRTLVGQGNELYIIMGGAVRAVWVRPAVSPTRSPAGPRRCPGIYMEGYSRAARRVRTMRIALLKTTRTIAVIMPNRQDIGIDTPWRTFERVSIGSNT